MHITAIGEENYSYFAPFLGETRDESHGYLGVIKDGLAVAAADFFIDFPALIIKNIYVDPACRRQGAAKLLIEAAAEIAEEAGIYDLMAYYGGDEAATSFYQNQGFTCLPGDALYMVPMRTVCTLKQYQAAKRKRSSKQTIPFDELSSSQRKKLVAAIVGRYDFAEELFREGSYDPRLSLAYLSEDDEPKGVILARPKERDVYVSACVVSGKSHGAAVGLLAAFVQEAEQYVFPDSNIYFLGRNEKLVRSLTSLFGDEMQKAATGWCAVKNYNDETTPETFTSI